MNLEALLLPRDDAAPSGENLEYDPAFTEMELAAQPGEERQMGDEVISAEEPDYKDVIEKATSVLERSHDIRAAVILASSSLRLKGFPGFADATTYVRRCLEDYWDTCHPQLDEDDDDDPTMRINAVLTLADPATVIRGLRLAPLAESRTFGRVCLRDIAIAEGEIPAPADMETVPDLTSIAAATQDSDPEFLKSVSAAVATALDDVKAIDAVFDEKTPGVGPDLSELERVLRKASRATTGDAVANDGSTESGDGAVTVEVGDVRPAGVSGAISSPSDVEKALERIIAYYERHEPSSPVPILLERAKRLVSADFITIMKDMAPDGLTNVSRVGGIKIDN